MTGGCPNSFRAAGLADQLALANALAVPDARRVDQM